MIIYKQSNLILEHSFDQHSKRHYFNGQSNVMHCHHYCALYTQLALDAKEAKLLAETAEDTFYSLLRDYYHSHSIIELATRIEIACQYYAAMGMGIMRVLCLGEDSGEVELTTSHVDSGWLKKWGYHNEPVNYISAGYITALFSTALDLPPRTFQAIEVQSIVMGASSSLFQVVRK